jgi:hypothetical protein
MLVAWARSPLLLECEVGDANDKPGVLVLCALLCFCSVYHDGRLYVQPWLLDLRLGRGGMGSGTNPARDREVTLEVLWVEEVVLGDFMFSSCGPFFSFSFLADSGRLRSTMLSPRCLGRLMRKSNVRDYGSVQLPVALPCQKASLPYHHLRCAQAEAVMYCRRPCE